MKMHFQLHFIALATFAVGAFALLQPGEPCTSADQCNFSVNSGTRFCCATLLGGSYCSECCQDANCPPIAGQKSRICVAGFPKYTGQPHTRFCSEAYVYPAGEPCFRNDMCKSRNCIGNLGYCGDAAQLPFGKCA